jgi:hypothetical protein
MVDILVKQFQIMMDDLKHVKQIFITHTPEGDPLFHYILENGTHVVYSRTELSEVIEQRPKQSDDKESISEEHVELNNDIIKIKEHLETEFPELKKWCCDGKITTVHGDVQVGKTGLQLAMIWISRYIYQQQTILILANLLSSYHRVLLSDIPCFNDKYCGGRYPIRVETLSSIVKQKSPESLKNKPLILLVGNAIQIAKLSKTQLVDFHLFVDEADTLVKCANSEKDNSKTGIHFRKIKHRARSYTRTTATPFAIWNEEDERPQITIRMHAPDSHRNLNDAEWCIVEQTVAKEIRGGGFHHVVDIIKTIFKDVMPSVQTRRKYGTILINVDSFTSKQTNLAKIIAEMEFPMKTRVFVMNSKGKSAIKEFTMAKDEGVQYTQSPYIGHLYDEFEKESHKTNEFMVHIIIAGLQASRAVSFRPSKKENGDGGINAMIYIPSSTSHMAQKYQALRWLGNYATDFPKQYIYTTQIVKDNLFHEVFYNLEKLSQKTQREGISRSQIEHLSLYDVGLHDRRTVDDTYLNDKILEHHIDYIDYNDIHIDTLNVVIMTDGFEYIDYPGFIYTRDRKIQNNQRKEIMSKLSRPIQSLQFAWNSARFSQMHNMKERFQGNFKYMCDAVAGTGEDDGTCRIPVVYWKKAFVDDTLTISDFREDTTYVFQTPKGTWRYFTVREPAKMGILTHRE